MAEVKAALGICNIGVYENFFRVSPIDNGLFDVGQAKKNTYLLQ